MAYRLAICRVWVKAQWGRLQLGTVWALRNFWARVRSFAGRARMVAGHTLKDWRLNVEVFALNLIASDKLTDWWRARKLRQIGPGLEIAYEQDERRTLVRCLRVGSDGWLI